MRLSELGEFGLLAELERRGLARGIEHDAAQVAGLVVTQDAVVEGIHLRLDWTTWRDLGFKAAAVNLSDLAASGARAGRADCHAQPSGRRACRGRGRVVRGLNEPGVPVLGGDTTRARNGTLSVTALGRSERVPGRGGAKPGDLLVVTGPLGGAGAGFRCGRHVRPPLRLGDGRRLARVAHAMPDISDGLAADSAHIARRSGVRLAIELERVPLADGAELADVGLGKDYELLAAAPEALGFAVIGRCEEGEGVALTLHGEPYELAGWDHFAR
jgi:thiamine-monophosphate kinase